MSVQCSKYMVVDKNGNTIQEVIFRTWDKMTIQKWINQVAYRYKEIAFTIQCQDGYTI